MQTKTNKNLKSKTTVAAAAAAEDEVIKKRKQICNRLYESKNQPCQSFKKKKFSLINVSDIYLFFFVLKYV